MMDEKIAKPIRDFWADYDKAREMTGEERRCRVDASLLAMFYYWLKNRRKLIKKEDK